MMIFGYNREVERILAFSMLSKTRSSGSGNHMKQFKLFKAVAQCVHVESKYFNNTYFPGHFQAYINQNIDRKP